MFPLLSLQDGSNSSLVLFLLLLSALGTNRSAQQVAHRVRALGLDRSGPSETPDGDRGGTASPEQDSPASDRESPVTSAPVQGEEGDWAVENMEDIFEQRAMRLQQMSQRMQASAVEDDGPIFSDDEEETQPQTAATSLPKAAGKTFGRGKLRGRGGGAAVDSLGERTNRDSDDEALEEEETAPAGNAGASSARMLLSDDEDA